MHIFFIFFLGWGNKKKKETITAQDIKDDLQGYSSKLTPLDSQTRVAALSQCCKGIVLGSVMGLSVASEEVSGAWY